MYVYGRARTTFNYQDLSLLFNAYALKRNKNVWSAEARLKRGAKPFS
jgi:hypothetical protein